MPTIQTVREISPLIVDPAIPADPVVRAIAEDVLAQLRYSFAATACADGEHAPGAFDRAARAFLGSRAAATRSRGRARAAALFEPGSTGSHPFGRFAALPVQEYRKSGSEAFAKRFGNLAIDKNTVIRALNDYHAGLARVPALRARDTDEAVTAGSTANGAPKIKLDPDVIEGLKLKKMRLYINKVRCLEETDEVGSDHIQMGGTVADAFGNTAVVSEFTVSKDFDTGEVVDFGTGRTFATWDLQTESVGFPYVYGAVVAMGERDDGGFHQFLKELWAIVGKYVTAAVAGLVGAEIGAALGSVIPGIGTVVGAIVGFLIGALVEWIINLFDNPDDVVDVKTLVMTLASSRKSYYDWAKLTTAAGYRTTLKFRGDGGRYDVECSYRVLPQ